MVGKTRLPRRKFLLFEGKTGKRKLIASRTLSSKFIKERQQEVKTRGGSLKVVSKERAAKLIRSGPKMQTFRTFGKQGTKKFQVSIDLGKKKKRRSR